MIFRVRLELSFLICSVWWVEGQASSFRINPCIVLCYVSELCN